MNNQKHELNLCPHCGCNLRAVRLSLEFTENFGKHVLPVLSGSKSDNGHIPIASGFPIPPKQVRGPYKRRKTGPLTKARSVITDALRHEVFKLKQQGFGRDKIAHQMNINRNTINHILYTDPKSKEIKDLYAPATKV